MKKIIRLTESDLVRIVKRVLNESPDPTLDFILTDQEKTCMKSYFKKPYTRRDYAWLTSEDGTQVHLGQVESDGYHMENYCKFDINNRPGIPDSATGPFDYNETTGVITFGKPGSYF